MLKRSDSVLLLSVLTLVTFLALYLFRAADDNRLTSWHWVFDHANAVTVFGILVVGVGVAALATRFSLPIPRSPVFLFVFAFAVSSAFWRVPEVIVDASRYFTQAKHLEVYGVGYFLKAWGTEILSWTDLPLIPFLYGLIFRYGGESRLLVQMFTSVLFSLTVVLTYAIGRDLWEGEVGFHAGLLLLGIPYLLIQVPLMLVDVPAMAALTLSVYAFMRALREKGIGTLVFSSLSLCLALLTKYSLWPMLSVLVVIALVHAKTAGLSEANSSSASATVDCRRGILGDRYPNAWGTVAARGGSVLLISGLFLAGLVLWKFDIVAGQMGLLTGYQGPGLRRWGESFISTFLFQTHPFITAGALYSLYVAFRKRDLRYLIVGWLVVMVVLFQVKRIRYTVPVFPFLALMASYGLGLIGDRGLRMFIVACTVVSSLVVSSFAYVPFTRVTSAANLKEAGGVLDSLEVEEVEVFTQPQEGVAVNPMVAVPILDLYTTKTLISGSDAGAFRRPEDADTSPLRFTWEYDIPRYYEDGSIPTHERAVVVITGDVNEPLSPLIAERVKGYRLARVFDSYEGAFEFKTLVKVFVPARQPP